MSNLTIALRRKGLTQNDAIRHLRKRYGIYTSISELSRALNRHKLNPEKLEPKQKAICDAVKEIAETAPTPEAPFGNEFTLKVHEAGIELKELHRIYCEWYDSDVDYATWHAAVTQPWVEFQYKILQKTDAVLKEVIRSNAQP
jgi:hypothetical protein